jgi:pimeloyl-ACP methyl ester carboxylesterase
VAGSDQKGVSAPVDDFMLQRYSAPLALRERRPASPRKTLLYVHGLGESGLCFEDLIRAPALAEYYHLAPDLPGYGKSPWPREGLGLDQLTERLGRWLEDEVSSPVVVLGHSMGGVLGLLLAERFPLRVAGLINIEGNISIEDCGFSGRIAGFTAQDFAGHGWAGVLDEVYRAGLDDHPLRTYFASMSLCDPRTLYRCSQDLVRLSESEALASRLAALPIPQVYLLGDPRGTGARSRALLDRAGLAWRAVPDAGHWPFLDQPELFLELLVRSLDEMFPRSAAGS